MATSKTISVSMYNSTWCDLYAKVDSVTRNSSGNITINVKWYLNGYAYYGHGEVGGSVVYDYTNSTKYPTDLGNTTLKDRSYSGGSGWGAKSGSLSMLLKASPERSYQQSSASGSIDWSIAAYSCTVTLNKQSGSGGTNSVTATYGSAMPSITPPTRQGYEFLGYFTSASGGTKYYNANGTSAKTADFTANQTLYAHWKVLSILHPVSGGTERTITNIKAVENGTVRNIISCYSVKDGVVRQGVK